MPPKSKKKIHHSTKAKTSVKQKSTMAKLKMYANKYGIPAGFIAATLIAAYRSELFKTVSGKHDPMELPVGEEAGDTSLTRHHQSVDSNNSDDSYYSLSDGDTSSFMEDTPLQPVMMGWARSGSRTRTGSGSARPSSALLAGPIAEQNGN